MALAIATNNAALNAAAAASSVNKDMETSMARLSSGKRINSASDDAAGVAISSRLSAEIRGTDQAIRNSLDGQALIDTAEGAHKEIENILQRMREVSVQAANDTNNTQDRANLQAEMNAMVTEIDRIAGTTTWAGEKLMEAEAGTNFSFQVGAKTGAKNQIAITINGMGSHALRLEADPTDVARTVSGSDLTIGTSDRTVSYSPSFSSRTANMATAGVAAGVVTPNNGNTSVTLNDIGVTTVPAAPAVATGGGTISLTDAALAHGFSIGLYTGVAVTIPAGSTAAQATQLINDGKGDGAAASTAASTDKDGHGVTATLDAATNVITLAAGGAVTGGAGAAGSGTGTMVTASSGASITTSAVAITMAAANAADVTYDATSAASVNAAIASINAATSLTNISATVGADGSDYAGKVILAHQANASAKIDGTAHTTATGMGTHLTLDTVEIAYDAANSDPGMVVTPGASASESILSFAANAGTVNLVLARTTGTGAPAAISSIAIDTTDDLQIAVDAINGAGTPGVGSVEHGYLAEIIADGSASGTIKLSQTSAGPAGTSTQTSFADLDRNNIGHSSKTEASPDGVFTIDANNTSTGVFVPNSVNTSGTVSLTLAGETLTATGISVAGAELGPDAEKIATAINASAQGYKAEAIKDVNGAYTGAVKITQPIAPAADMDVNNADKARESIVSIDAAIQTVNIQRSKLGAVSNRLSHTINNLTNISSNLSAAQGGIEDADFAHETTMLAKNQILQQASTAMLAQANASKQNVLSLLQG
jgi:flagellin